MMTSNQRGIAGLQDLEVKLKRVDPQLRARLVAGCVERVDFHRLSPINFFIKAPEAPRLWVAAGPASSLS